MWKPIILDVECIVCNKSLQKINHNPQESTRKMGKISCNRRLRTPNWSVEEKQYLLELIKQRKEVVTKSNNGPNHYEEKHVAWNEILGALAAKFGSKFSGSSTKKVKTQWQNMKRIAREEISLNGPVTEKYSKLSLEVCEMIELVKDGVLTGEHNALNETMMSNVEIKTERIEEENNQPKPSCSGINNNRSQVRDNQNCTVNNSNNFDSSSSSVSDLQICEANEFEILEPIDAEQNIATTDKINASSMTEIPLKEESNQFVNLFQKEVQEYFKFTAAEKEFKMDSLKEERQVLRAMRETAELNKIIAEQKLKHVLWVKKQEIS